MNITNISIQFIGRKGRERKDRRQIIHLKRDEGHNIYDESQLVSLQNQAWLKLDNEGYKTVRLASLTVNHGKLDGEMVFVELLPKQRVRIER